MVEWAPFAATVLRRSRRQLARAEAACRFARARLRVAFPCLAATGDARRVAMPADQLTQTPAAVFMLEREAELAALKATLAAAPMLASVEGTESSFAILHGLYWLAANFAARTPTLLVVDDLHWADEPSLRWLVYFARRLEGLPLLLLVGTRPPLQADFPALVAELLADPMGAVIRPGSLGEKSAALLAG